MSYISSNDARRQNSTAEVEGFSTPAEGLFACTCHGKRWPLSMLRMENNGQRHCPNQANRQGGSIDRDVIRDYDRVELERRAVDDATPVRWPISPLETLACVETIEPRSQTVLVGGVSGVFVIRGQYLSASDTLLLVAADPAWPPDGLNPAEYFVVVASDGLSVTVTVLAQFREYQPAPPAPLGMVPTPLVNFNLVYNDVVYEDVILVR